MSIVKQFQTPRWIYPLLAPARFKGAYGGRGSGKSYAFADMLIEAHMLDPNAKSVCIREVQKSIEKSVKALIEERIRVLEVGEYFEINKTTIRSKLGAGEIIFLGMQDHTAESIKSLQGFSRAWVEEAQSLSETSLDLLIPTIRSGVGEIWFTWNPRHETDAVEKLLRSKDRPENAIVVQVNYQDNPWFPDMLRDDMEYARRTNKDKYAHIWCGDYIRLSDSAVFKNWSVEEFEAPHDALFRYGADWGFANDPTVLVRCYNVGRKLYIDYEAYMIGCEIINLPELFLSVPDSDKWPIVADSSRPETISHMRKHGYPKIMPAVKGKDSVYEGVEWLKSYEIVVHPRCKHTIDELTLYAYKIDQATGSVIPKLKDEHNHVIDALRYACEGLRRVAKAKVPNDFVPIKTFSNW